MSQACNATVPDLDGNPDLFQDVFGLACKCAGPGLPVEVVLCQLVYHVTEELLISGIPAGHIRGVVEVAVQGVTQEQEVLLRSEGGAA